MRRNEFLPVLGLVCAAGLLAGWYNPASRAAQAPEIRLLTTEVSLGKIRPGIVVPSLTVSPDSRRVAYVAKRGDGWSVVVEGVVGKEYQGF
jgi:hypothetical protein